MTQQVLQIELPKLYYTAGEIVRGKIVYTPKADRNIHGIHIHFTGYEFCENTVLSDIPFQKKWILDGATTVFGNKCVINRGGHQTTTHKYSEAEGVTIKAGNYAWPFSFQIPKNIPPSCEYRAGKVKIDYAIAALVDIPWARSIRAVQHLRVGLPYVIDPDRPKSTFKNEKSFIIHSHNTTGIGKHVLYMEAYVDRPVTYTGDKITVFLKVNNNSGRNVQSIKVKLKQIWSYGTGYFEKYTITKIKHKDRKFPLAEGEYKTEIPMVVPNCDLRPTIQNASLIRVSYHITIIASIRAGADLRVRIPIIMASYPPVNKNIASTPKALRKPKKEEKEEEEEENTAKIEPVLIDWDAPVPGQQPSDMDVLNAAPMMPNFVPTTQFAPMSPALAKKPNIEPKDFFIESFDPQHSFDAFEEVKPSPQSINEIEFNSRLSAVSEAVNEMDSAIQWAASGQLEHAVEIDPQMNSEKAQAALTASAKSLADALAKLLDAAKKQSVDDFTKSVVDVSGRVVQLTSAAKTAAYQLGDPQFQQAVLQSSKAIGLGSQQLFLQGKEIVNYDPFTSAYSLEFMNNTMEATSKNVQENCINLAYYTEQAYSATTARASQILQSKASLETFLAAFVNPFGDTNDNASLEDVERNAQQFAGITSQFVIGCHGSSEEIIQGAQNLVAIVHSLMQNVKGIAKTHPLIGQHLMENVKRAAAATEALIDAAAVALKQGNVTNPQNVEKDLNAAAKENHQRASNIISIVRAEQQRLIQEMKEVARRKEEEERAKKAAEEREKEKFELEDRAERELAKAAEAIAVAADKLREAVRKPKDKDEVHDPFTAHQVDLNSDVIDASSSVAIAIAELLKAAALAQSERARLARDNRPDTPYHKDPAWTEGLISASRKVVSLIEQLVTAVGGELEEEVIISLARAITAATAQLMSAERAKGDADSEAHKKLTAAAKVVARTTTELVQKMKDAAEHKPEPLVQPSPKPNKPDESVTEARARELEAAIKIAKLEKELELARQEQLKLRQDKYKS